MVAKELQGPLLQELSTRIGDGLEVREEGTQTVLWVTVPKLRDLMGELRSNPQLAFDYLIDVTGLDYPEEMVVVYHLKSIGNGLMAKVKVRVSKANPEVPSVCELWPGADWLERETYDLLGIRFTGHPNLTRILLPDDFEGYPLRKEYKLAPRE